MKTKQEFIEMLKELKGSRAEAYQRRYVKNMQEIYLGNRTYDSVRGFYINPSNYKLNAEYHILRFKVDYDGKDYCILGGNSHMFSCAWRLDNWLIVHTAYNTYKINLDKVGA